MNREGTLKRVQDAWNDLLDACAGLSDVELCTPGVTGDWSVRDILAHISAWEGEAMKHIPVILAGGRPPRYSVTYGGIDAFNAQVVEKARSLNLAAVIRQRDETHESLIAYVNTLPEEQFTTETRVRRRLRLDTYHHYPMHTQAIREWRGRNGN